MDIDDFEDQIAAYILKSGGSEHTIVKAGSLLLILYQLHGSSACLRTGADSIVSACDAVDLQSGEIWGGGAAGNGERVVLKPEDVRLLDLGLSGRRADADLVVALDGGLLAEGVDLAQAAVDDGSGRHFVAGPERR
ncbi:MAG: hypothetical protein LBQ90_10095, partial [Synergistaceae bacterium]|nr:hypothetical protein [Synergistaceae bacterium]